MSVWSTALDGSGAAAQVTGERSGSPAHQPPPPYNPMWATHTFGPLEQGKCLQFSFNPCLVVLASAMLNNNTHNRPARRRRASEERYRRKGLQGEGGGINSPGS